MTHHAGLDVSLAETAICIETRRASAVMRTMPDRTDRDDARPGPDHARRLVPAGPRPPCAPPAGAARRRPFHGGRGRPTPAATGWSAAGARGRWARIRVSPRCATSRGATGIQGRVSRCRDGPARAALHEAAHSLLVRGRTWSALRAWGMQVAKHRGMVRARVAAARKLAVVLHRMWRDQTGFRFGRAPHADAGPVAA